MGTCFVPPPLPPSPSTVGLLFLYRALDSHPFFPLRAALGCCILTAAAVCVPAGVVSASAEPSSWHTRVVLVGVVVGVGGRFTVFAAHSPPHSGRPPHASPSFHLRAAHFQPSTQRPGGPPCASPPRWPAWGASPPPLCGSCVHGALLDGCGWRALHGWHTLLCG